MLFLPLKLHKTKKPSVHQIMIILSIPILFLIPPKNQPTQKLLVLKYTVVQELKTSSQREREREREREGRRGRIIIRIIIPKTHKEKKDNIPVLNTPSVNSTTKSNTPPPGANLNTFGTKPLYKAPNPSSLIIVYIPG